MNTINLTSLDLTLPQKSVLSKGPSFVPTPKAVYRYELRRYFTQFVNQIRNKLRQSKLNQDQQNQQELPEPIKGRTTRLKMYFHHHLDKTNVMALCITLHAHKQIEP